MSDAKPAKHVVSVFVNEHSVHLAEHEVTGMHIKDSAIEQGVAIRRDFEIEVEGATPPRVIGDDERVRVTEHERFLAKPRSVTILVNEREVVMHAPSATGLQIKEAAIAQNVPIQLDFVLSEEIGERKTKVIGDTDLVHLKPHHRFIAVAPDDNS